MDHTSYARWLSVNGRDMLQLYETHPDIHAKFLKGNFVVQKSPHKYLPTITELELLMCRFIRSLLEGHFPLYVQVCDELCA